MPIPKHPHSQTVESLAKELKSTKEGLSHDAVAKNLSIYGLNEIGEKRHNLFRLFLTQFKSPLVYILVVAAILSFFWEICMKVCW